MKSSAICVGMAIALLTIPVSKCKMSSEVRASDTKVTQRQAMDVGDPADVRKVVLEEELAVDSEKVRALRERLFGNWEMNWVGFNYARDFTLPGQKDGPIAFLMYPYAESSDGPVDSLDPASFAYTIFAQEIV